MEFDWLHLPYDLRRVPPREIEETFEDPFGLRLLPEIPSAGGEARYFNLGRTTAGRPIFSVFWTNGKQTRVILARDVTPEETAFYDRRNTEAGSAGDAPAPAQPAPGVQRVLSAWAEVPAFEDEESEAAFWAETQIDPLLMGRDIHKAITPESAAIMLKLDPRMLARIKRLARGRYLDHHAMILQWLAERLEKEA